MTVSDVIVADEIPVGSAEPHGVIYKIRQNVTNNNILNYVQPTTNYQHSGNIEYVVKWDGAWQGGGSQNTYLLIDFKDRFIFPTHYSMKGCYSYCFAKEWILYGLNSTNGSPVEITRNTSTGSTFCGVLSTCYDGNYCCNDDWGTFIINNPTGAFRYLKIMSLVPSCGTSRWYMAISGFEIFGILSKDGRTSLIQTPTPRKTYCFRSYPINSHLPVYIFLRLFSVFIS
jgi:hypothetical protein